MNRQAGSLPAEARFLTGEATYLDDFHDPVLDGAAWVVFVRSTSAHATFSVDASRARSEPGVLSVVTAENNPVWPTIAYSPIHPVRFAQPLLAETKVRYVGEPVAAVIAESYAQAVDAAEAVEVEYDELAPVMTIEASLADEQLLFSPADICRRNEHAPHDSDAPYSNLLRSEADDGHRDQPQQAAFEAADHVVRRRFRNPRQVAAPIECRGAAAAWTPDGHLHVWVSTQTPHSYRSRIAPLYDLPLANIHVVAGPCVGGGFGGKGAPGPEEQIVPYLAQAVGRPVRWRESRAENLSAAPQGRAEELEITLAGSSAGDLEAIRVELFKDAGAYPSSGAGLPSQWSRPMASGTYRIPHVEFAQRTVVTNAPPVSALRGAGRGPILAALERAVDLFAHKVGMDPSEVRRRNLLSEAEMPYTSPVGAVFDEADYAQALELALEHCDYTALRAEQATRRASGDRVQLGIGIGSYNHRTCGGGGESALVRINLDGSATVVTGTTDQGQGHARSWRKIAAGELGIDPDQIDVIEGVTDEIATGVGAIGSRSLQTAGMAIHEASAEVVAQGIETAAAMLEAAPADVVLDRAEGAFYVTGTPARSLRWADLAATLAEREEALKCDHVYNNDGRDVYPSGCHVAVVEVDCATGGWHLRSYTAVDDAGVRLDEQIVEDQLRGGIALGVAQVLGEEVRFDEAGNPLTASFLDYSILTADQMCQVDLVAQVTPSSFNVGGYKAVGESGPIGATAATHNAVIDAITHFGIEHVELPCTPQRVWEALRSAGVTAAD